MKLYAISDIHLGYEVNREALKALPSYPQDWLILAGDVGETMRHFHLALSLLTRRFARVFWVPGNHDLWTLPPTVQPQEDSELRGEAKYQQLVAICRQYGVVTPEDPFVSWTGPGGPALLAPLFLLYDYTFRPPEISAEEALAWAAESNVVCADEQVLYPDPYPTREAWCAARCLATEKRLEAAASPDQPFILINHFPLHQSLVRIPRIPRFSLWCGTTRTADWHRRFPTLAAVHGHLHVRATDYLDGVRFEEVSLGYPRQWKPEQGMASYLREILPGPQEPAPAANETIWRY